MQNNVRVCESIHTCTLNTNTSLHTRTVYIYVHTFPPQPSVYVLSFPRRRHNPCLKISAERKIHNNCKSLSHFRRFCFSSAKADMTTLYQENERGQGRIYTTVCHVLKYMLMLERIAWYFGKCARRGSALSLLSDLKLRADLQTG